MTPLRCNLLGAAIMLHCLPCIAPKMRVFMFIVQVHDYAVSLYALLTQVLQPRVAAAIRSCSETLLLFKTMVPKGEGRWGLTDSIIMHV